ncbi:MAG: serine hydrolase [Clostridia bacterium]|nr:serine hydrolase [Clostridia bacterium]
MLVKSENKISAGPILEFYRELDKYNVENHSLIILYKGEVAFEHYIKPYSAEMPHTMFSLTKSVVSTAVGFAIDEGLFSLDDKVIDIFPEYEACESDEWDNITVRSLLTMQSNKEFSFTQDMRGNYVEMFMKAPFRQNGRGFLYSNNDAHVVAAIVQKKSGMNLVNYLTPRLFEPLGIDKPFWEFNCVGELVGGTGCYMKLRDLAKIGQCYLNDGKWNGEQVIPEWWTKEATKMHVRFGNKSTEGYGYLFWIHKGGYSMTGMYGQQVTCFPEKDLVMASFNCCLNDGDFSRSFENILPRAFEEEPDSKVEEQLRIYLESKNVKAVPCEKLPKIPVDKTFRLSKLSDIIAGLVFPANVIPRSVICSMAMRPGKNLNNLSFALSEDVLTIKWKEDDDEVVIDCGLDGKPRETKVIIKGYPYILWSYAFMKDGRLNVVVKPLNTLSTTNIVFDFYKNKVKIKIDGTPDFVEFISKNANKSDFVNNHPKMRPYIMKVVNKALLFMQRPMTFR